MRKKMKKRKKINFFSETKKKEFITIKMRKKFI